MDSYQKFLASKVKIKTSDGFVVDRKELHPSTMPHQADAILWALRKAKAMISMSFGLGKTHVQIEILRLIQGREGGRVLVVCPLGVKHQFSEEDGPRLGVGFRYVKNDEDVLAADTSFHITNYERVRDGGIDVSQYVAVSLDEGSVLRSYGTKTTQEFIAKFEKTPYRFVATATPSPNNFLELIHYADFLGILDRGLALTRWFARDSKSAGNLTLYPHHEKDFWLWMASWALFVNKPSDLGYSDEGYDLPELQVHWHRLTSNHERAWDEVDNFGQRHLFVDATKSLQQASHEKRASLGIRIERAAEIVEAAGPDEHWLIWHHLEDERHAICKSIPDAIDVYGSQDLELREERILDFAHGKYRILATKPEIAGSGCNFQRYCSKNIFVGASFKFQDFIQAVHRTHRFQQTEKVEIHIIHTDAEDGVVEVMQQKWERHNELVAKMTDIIKEYGLSTEALRTDVERSLGVERIIKEGKYYTAVHNDCVVEIRNMLPDNSVDMICTSPPFSNHYEYTDNYNDFGHNESDDAFFAQMDFLVPELLRVLKPGRVAAIHMKDLLHYGHQNGVGFPTVNNISDKMIEQFKRHGFYFTGRITIVTDVVRENASTYRLGWTENSKDSTKMGVGMPEYILLFRKAPSDTSNGYGDEPVKHSKQEYTRGKWQLDASAFWRSSGDRHITPDDIEGLTPEQAYRLYRQNSAETVYSYVDHVALNDELDRRSALPSGFQMFPLAAPGAYQEHVWTDINFMNTLNSQQGRKRQENHVCPMAIDQVERLIERFSEPGDLILEPFAGLFTVPVTAVKMGRRAYGTELNPDYYRWGVQYCESAEIEADTPTLFDLMDIENEDGVELESV